MSKPFQFKQFTINQDHDGFKVGTDGCLLGAWADLSNSDYILDIGTGSGLILLMCAQKNTRAKLTGIEIDANSAKQAEINFSNSPWKDRIAAHHTSLEEFTRITKTRFDHILCNPPFFKSSTPSKTVAQTIARHEQSLSLETLLKNAFTLNSNRGQLSIIIPDHRFEDLKRYASETGYSLNRICFIRPFPNAEANRVLISLSKEESTAITTTLHLYQAQNKYSEDTKELLSPFYLKL